MMIKNTSYSYGVISKFLHWLIAILIIGMLIFGFLLGYVPKDYQGVAYNTHKLIGVTILSLMLIRLLWALTNIKPSILNVRPWERASERGVHFLLYFIVICMPLAGWIGSMAAGHPPHVGSVDLNLPIEKNEILADSAFDMHGTLAFVIIALLSIHVLAALYHHFVKKDDVLRRMLP